MVARLAFELAARRDLVGLDTAAAGANWISIRIGPAHLAERLVSLVLAHLIDGFEREAASCCRE